MCLCFLHLSDSQPGKENKAYGGGRTRDHSHCAAAGWRWETVNSCQFTPLLLMKREYPPPSNASHQSKSLQSEDEEGDFCCYISYQIHHLTWNSETLFIYLFIIVGIRHFTDKLFIKITVTFIITEFKLWRYMYLQQKFCVRLTIIGFTTDSALPLLCTQEPLHWSAPRFYDRKILPAGSSWPPKTSCCLTTKLASARFCRVNDTIKGHQHFMQQCVFVCLDHEHWPKCKHTHWPIYTGHERAEWQPSFEKDGVLPSAWHRGVAQEGSEFIFSKLCDHSCYYKNDNQSFISK